MIVFEMDKPFHYTSKFYHECDVNENDVIEWEDVTSENVGQYVKFDDGSEWYAKILGCTTRVIVTSGGMYRRAGLVHVALPLPPNTSVFCLPAPDVHPLVRGYTNYERTQALKYLNGEKTAISRRIRMLAVDEVQKELEQGGVNKHWFARRLYEEANMKGGKNFNFAMTAIAKLNQMDITTPMDKIEMHNGGLLAGHLGRNLPNKSDKLKLNATANITNMIKKTKVIEEPIEEYVPEEEVCQSA